MLFRSFVSLAVFYQPPVYHTPCTALTNYDEIFRIILGVLGRVRCVSSHQRPLTESFSPSERFVVTGAEFLVVDNGRRVWPWWNVPVSVLCMSWNPL